MTFGFTGEGDYLSFVVTNIDIITSTTPNGNSGNIVIRDGLVNLLAKESLNISILYNHSGVGNKGVSVTLSSSPAMNYIITAGNENDIFAVDSSTGAITIATGKASELNPLTRSAYLLVVSYTDRDSASQTQEVLVRVR